MHCSITYVHRTLHAYPGRIHCACGTTANVIDCIASIEHHLLVFHSFFFRLIFRQNLFETVNWHVCSSIAGGMCVRVCAWCRSRNFHFYDIFGLLSFEFLYALKLNVDINLHPNAYYQDCECVLSARCANTLLSNFYLKKYIFQLHRFIEML